MNQSVRSHEVATDKILGSLLQAATTVAPHSPELDRLAEQIEYIKLPQWRPSNTAAQVFDRRHHETLGRIAASVSPKAPGWRKVFAKEKTAIPPTMEELSAALLDLSRYLDDTELSLKAVAREEAVIQDYLNQMSVFKNGLDLFQDALDQHLVGPVRDRLTKAIEDRKNDIAHLYASYNYAKGSYYMARDSLNTSASQAKMLQEAITLTIRARQAGKKDRNLLLPSDKAPASLQRRREVNRIQPKTPQVQTPAEQLAELASQVRNSLVHQQRAISLMQENTRDIHNLSQPR